MGNRANFVLIDDGGWQLFYSHLAGCRVLGLTWPEFTVEWLYDGVNEIAADVGADPSLVRFRRGDKKIEAVIETHQTPTAPAHLVTVVDAEGDVNAWAVRPYASAAWCGPRLPKLLPSACPRSLALEALPDSGVHVDVRRGCVSIWVTIVEPGLLAALAELWPGWQTEMWGDRYETHLARCRGVVKVPALDLVAGSHEAESWLRKRIFRRFDDSANSDDESWAVPDPSMVPPTHAEGRQWSVHSRSCGLGV